jgi:WD40 repeat protein
MDTGKPINTIKWNTIALNAVAIAPDGKKVVSASDDKTCIIWNINSGKPIHTLKGHTRSVTAVAITSDGKKAVSTSEDKTCIIWDLDSGEMLARLCTDSGINTVSLTSKEILFLFCARRDRSFLYLLIFSYLRFLDLNFGSCGAIFSLCLLERTRIEVVR